MNPLPERYQLFGVPDVIARSDGDAKAYRVFPRATF